MTKRVKRVLIVALMALMAVGVVSCGEDSEGDSANSGPSIMLFYDNMHTGYVLMGEESYVGVYPLLNHTNGKENVEYSYEWRSSNTTVATIPPNGDIHEGSPGRAPITVKAPGKTTITVTATATGEPTFTGSLDMVVKNEAEGVVELRNSFWAVLPRAERLIEDGWVYEWESSNMDVLTIDLTPPYGSETGQKDYARLTRITAGKSTVSLTLTKGDTVLKGSIDVVVKDVEIKTSSE